MTKKVAKPNKQPEPAKDLVKPYEPTPYERRTLDTLRDRNAKKPLAPRMKVTNEKGATKLVPDHAEPSIAHVRLLEALGTRDFDFLEGLLKQLCNVGSHGKTVDENGLNFMLSVVKGIEPRDQVEAMLAAQMAATHNAIMTFARRLAHVDTLAQQDSAERAYNKLARTFASQVEALKRYRSAGEQTVRVEHVGGRLSWIADVPRYDDGVGLIPLSKLRGSRAFRPLSSASPVSSLRARPTSYFQFGKLLLRHVQASRRRRLLPDLLEHLSCALLC